MNPFALQSLYGPLPRLSALAKAFFLICLGIAVMRLGFLPVSLLFALILGFSALVGLGLRDSVIASRGLILLLLFSALARGLFPGDGRVFAAESLGPSALYALRLGTIFTSARLFYASTRVSELGDYLSVAYRVLRGAATSRMLKKNAEPATASATPAGLQQDTIAATTSATPAGLQQDTIAATASATPAGPQQDTIVATASATPAGPQQDTIAATTSATPAGPQQDTIAATASATPAGLQYDAGTAADPGRQRLDRSASLAADPGMMLSLSLVFIPRVFESYRRIREAAESRGFGARKNRLFSGLTLLQALLFSSIKNSLRTAEALEARAYTPERRIMLLRLKPADLLLMVSGLGLAIFSFV